MVEKENITFVEFSEINDAQKLSTAFLIMEALPTYYRIDGIDIQEMAKAVAALIGVSGSDIEEGFVALCKDDVVGVMSYVASDALSLAQLVGAQGILRRLTKDSKSLFRENLRSYDKNFDTVPLGSLYLSRFAVDKSHRGSGLAKQMMEKFLAISDNSGKRNDIFSLHVDRNNERAIKFYQKCGYVVQPAESRYFTMVCNVDTLD